MMDKLNDHIEFLEMTESEPQLLIWLLELRRHRQDNWKQRAEEAEAKLVENEKSSGFWGRVAASETIRANKAEKQLAELAKQKPVGTVSIVMDWNTHRNVATVNMRHDLVVSEMKDGDELFTRAVPAIEGRQHDEKL